MTNTVIAILATLGVSSIPMLELRLGIPLGVGMGLSTATATAVAIVGNILQIPIAIVVVAWAYRWFMRYPRVRNWIDRVEKESGRHAPLIRRWGWIGLTLFVLLPLPGTGAWGGVVLSRLLHVRMGSILLGLSLGVALSGLLFGLGTQGVIAVYKFFF